MFADLEINNIYFGVSLSIGVLGGGVVGVPGIPS
jgi:hypothetical protein